MAAYPARPSAISPVSVARFLTVQGSARHNRGRTAPTGSVRFGDGEARRSPPKSTVRSRSGIPSIEIEHEGKTMFAVIKTGGKQYRVAAEDVIRIDKIKGDPGQTIEFGEVLVVGGENVSLGAPTVAGASVAAEVIEQGRGPKIIAFKKRRRKNSRRKRGHRQEFTLVRVTEILTDGAKPSKKAASRPKKKASAEASPAAEPSASAIPEADPGQTT
jgi:large subunit ribosomal protein L21